jgi:hypothetical protein
MKFFNPFLYPFPILLGCLFLILSIRVLRLPIVVVFPIAGGLAVGGAMVRHSQEKPALIALQALQGELAEVKTLAEQLATKAELLRQEAEQILRNREISLELLSAVQYGCDLAIALPGKVDRLAQHLPSETSLLSVEDLQKRLKAVRQQQVQSQGATQASLAKLAQSLQRNIELTQAGSDIRQSQILNLTTLIQDSAGTLQQLQNSLRSINLEDADQVSQLQSFTEELSRLQQEVDLLI